MTNRLLTAFLVLASQPAFASLLDVFELEDGHTNWQYVANTSGTLLILALSYTLVRLVHSNRRARNYNRKLVAIQHELEQRVRERTATLDESNRLLQESNRGLEDEIAEHRATTNRLRDSEAYISSILQSMPSMLIGLNEAGEITQWNRRAQEISGLSADSVLGRNLWEAYPIISVSPDHVSAARSENKTISVKQSQRDQYYFDATIFPLEGVSETGVVLMIDDVTQQVLAETRLIQRDKMSSMGEMAAAMAQDINTPLQSIVEDVREVLAALPEETPQLRERLDNALARGAQGSAIINNLLEFSGARAGDKQPADVAALLDRSLALAGTMLSVPSGLRFADIRIERDYADDLPQVPCYVAELQQVFLSILRHCCHALGEVQRAHFEPVIQVSVHHYYEAVWIKIAHNGCGISLDEQQCIFEPFFSDADDARSGDYDAGRRLSYPYFIISEQHRGQLALTSDPESGTTFHIQLQLD